MTFTQEEGTVLPAGAIVDDYEIVDVAGRGGMGVVYRAKQRSLDRMVAVKVVRSEIAERPDYRERFLEEAHLAAAVDHPHVVSVHEIGESTGLLFIAMQWIDGEDLGRILVRARPAPLPPAQALTLATQLASALDAVHAVGLVHRDVKPANVLIRHLDGAQYAYLTDFGVARMRRGVTSSTTPGQILGTTGYLSPEQLLGQSATPASDFYALGCVLYEMLTGCAPFAAADTVALRLAHARAPRPVCSEAAPMLGRAYDGLFQKLLAIDPDERIGSGAELIGALRHLGVPPEGWPVPLPAVQEPLPVKRAETLVAPDDLTRPTPVHGPPATGADAVRDTDEGEWPL